jgi:hypothetical protein
MCLHYIYPPHRVFLFSAPNSSIVLCMASDGNHLLNVSISELLLSYVQDIAFSASACLIFLACAFLEAYYSTGAWATNCNDINGSGLLSNGCRTIYEWAFAAVNYMLLSITFVFISGIYVHHVVIVRCKYIYRLQK